MNYKKYIGKEDAFQTSVATLMDLKTKFWFHVANERKTKTKINKRGQRYSLEGAILKAKGVKPGLPDVVCIEPRGDWAGLVIELKVYPNKTTNAQETWLNRFRALNYYVLVSNSLDEVEEIINKYFQ